MQQLDTHRAHMPHFTCSVCNGYTQAQATQQGKTRALRHTCTHGTRAQRAPPQLAGCRYAHTTRAHNTHATHNAVDAGCDVCYFRQAVQVSVCTCGKSRKERTTTQMKDTSRSSGMCQYKLYAFFNVYKRRSGTRMFSSCA